MFSYEPSISAMNDVIRSIWPPVTLAYASAASHTSPDSCAQLDALRRRPFVRSDREEDAFAATAHAPLLLGIKVASPQR